MLPSMLWGGTSAYSGVIILRRVMLEPALNEVLPVDQRHRTAEARRTRAEKGGARIVRTCDLRKTMRCENSASMCNTKKLKWRRPVVMKCGVRRMYDVTPQAMQSCGRSLRSH
jgi:hypothetical protein